MPGLPPRFPHAPPRPVTVLVLSDVEERAGERRMLLAGAEALVHQLRGLAPDRPPCTVWSTGFPTAEHGYKRHAGSYLDEKRLHKYGDRERTIGVADCLQQALSSFTDVHTVLLLTDGRNALAGDCAHDCRKQRRLQEGPVEAPIELAGARLVVCHVLPSLRMADLADCGPALHSEQPSAFARMSALCRRAKSWTYLCCTPGGVYTARSLSRPHHPAMPPPATPPAAQYGSCESSDGSATWGSTSDSDMSSEMHVDHDAHMQSLLESLLPREAVDPTFVERFVQMTTPAAAAHLGWLLHVWCTSYAVEADIRPDVGGPILAVRGGAVGVEQMLAAASELDRRMAGERRV